MIGSGSFGATLALSVSFANPWGLAALGLAIPVLLLHILRPRRQSVVVSSTFLWRDLERPVSSAVPWQKLRWSALLLAQLLAVVLGALALARPVRLTEARLAAHTVFIVDASGSMAAADGAPNRLATAKARAIALRRQLPDGGVASVVMAGQRARVVLTTSAESAAFADSLRTIDTTEGHPDFADAFALAESLDTAASDIGYVLLSDGGLTDEEQRQLPPGTRYERIGARDTNRAITRLTVEPRGSALRAIATVKHLGGAAATQELAFDVDGKRAITKPVELKPGASVDVEVDLPPGDRVEAFLEGDDLLPVDNRAVAVAGRRPPIDVAIVGEPSFVADLLGAIPGVTVSEVADAARIPKGTDVAVFAGAPVPAKPTVPYLAIAPPGGTAAVKVTGSVDEPVLALVRNGDPLVEGLDFTEVGIATAQRVESPSADVLLGAEGAPLLLTGTDGTVRYAYLSFNLGDSNLPVQIAFPLLGDRLLTELSGTAQPSSGLNVGAPLPIPPATEATVTEPGGRTRTIAADAPAPEADRAGFWTIRIGDAPEKVVAVNPPLDESQIAPAPQLRKEAPSAAAAAARRGVRGEIPLLPWIVWPLIAVLLAEWWLARRSLGVGRRQWRIATIMRVAVAGLLLAALLAPSISLAANRTATVFVLDDSASLGPAGRAAAAEWVRDAMKGRSDDDVAGVVAFGGAARLDRLVQPSSEYDRPGVEVDESATNMESALRLAAAVLPQDARRRIVVVSDGRQTAGSAVDEAAILREAGIPVDVAVIEPSQGGDAAVAALSVPRLVRQGDAVKLTAEISSTTSGPAELVLLRGTKEVERRAVELAAGSQTVEFTDPTPAAPGEIVRYQVRVDRGNDTQPRNDAAFAAVPVEGPARVLLVEGTSGEAATLQSALRAGGLVADTIGAPDLPDATALSAYTSIVFVDVDARELSGAQIDALDTAVRDLGRGLVTVGGERSYGVGGYRASPIEDLLPVISEILDPKRRKTVAEVLSVDTSGSMANCHCAENDPTRQRIFGGVNKTDIARAAATRAIEALDATDEVGVLAWNSGTKWMIDLQPIPDQDVIDAGLNSLTPRGNTNISDSLTDAAKALRDSTAALKHIILFSDGFTDEKLIAKVAEQAGALYEEDGITVSVVATGEGAAKALEKIAVNGHGRFYPGRDLGRVPQVIAEEAVIASRDFITEGQFLPEVTANTPATANLTASPPLFGYVATTAKGTATTALRIGPDRDPLLATWQAGLGTVTSWTSDGVPGWSKQWAAWDGFVPFWTSVVKDTFPSGDTAGAAQATLSDGRLLITVQGSGEFPDGATATARVAGPDGQRFEVTLERTAAGEFSATVPASRAGSYAIGATVTANSSTVLSSSAIANESYPAEYRPGAADTQLLSKLSNATGGRGVIEASAAFDAAGLTEGRRIVNLRWPFLLAAVLLWPLAVLVSRLSLRGTSLASATAGARRGARRMREALPTIANDPVNRPAPERTDSPAKRADDRPATPQPATREGKAVSDLLAAKRARRQGDGSAD